MAVRLVAARVAGVEAAHAVLVVAVRELEYAQVCLVVSNQNIQLT